MGIEVNRAVAVLTPLVFAPLAGAVSVLAAKYVPGIDVDEQSLEAIFIAGATVALAKAGLWLKGWQDWEKREAIVAADAVDDAPDLEDEFDLDLEEEIFEDDAVPAGA